MDRPLTSLSRRSSRANSARGSRRGAARWTGARPASLRRSVKSCELPRTRTPSFDESLLGRTKRPTSSETYFRSRDLAVSVRFSALFRGSTAGPSRPDRFRELIAPGRFRPYAARRSLQPTRPASTTADGTNPVAGREARRRRTAAATRGAILRGFARAFALALPPGTSPLAVARAGDRSRVALGSGAGVGGDRNLRRRRSPSAVARGGASPRPDRSGHLVACPMRRRLECRRRVSNLPGPRSRANPGSTRSRALSRRAASRMPPRRGLRSAAPEVPSVLVRFEEKRGGLSGASRERRPGRAIERLFHSGPVPSEGEGARLRARPGAGASRFRRTSSSGPLCLAAEGLGSQRYRRLLRSWSVRGPMCEIGRAHV